MPGCHTLCPLCGKDMEDCECADLHEYYVYASYPEEGETYTEVHAGSVYLKKLNTAQDHPEYLEIDGVCYYPQH